MKKIMLPIMSAVLGMSALLASQVSAATTFKDVQANHWAKSAIESAVSKGYFKGYGNGLFKPNASVTRAEFASLISRVAKEMPLSEAGATDSFKDLEGHWSKAEVDRAVSLGFIQTKDYPNGFKPNTPITREEMAKWMSSGLMTSSEEYKKAFVETKETLLPAKEAFKPGIAQAKLPYLAIAMGTNLMNGFPDGSFGMDKTTTRAESSAILLRLEGVLKKDATSFEDLNELRMVGVKKTNLELVSSLTTGNTSISDISGKRKTFRNGAGSLVFHRLLAVNVSDWDKKKSIYAPLFVNELDKSFLNSRNVIPLFSEITIYPKATDFSVAHYMNGVIDMTGGFRIDNGLDKKFGYQTLPNIESAQYFAKHKSGVKMWVVNYISLNKASGQFNMDDGSFVTILQNQK
ncbi:S-layer homology domain-containing protein [Paenibacillus silvae]|uniref:S-layer homology domain-containing protein n=1 Tax=Paenibacillus silvae TaxID=1325358 RepID=UPI0025A1E628|nr:S-layer homology domain-containing protein [Paenibacillus silvae]MDM5281003.1 S-layer homology domain-containing protein [Paenibacillus silvae]